MNKNTLLKYMAAAILLGASSTAPAAVSYFNDFSGSSDGKWSNYTTFTTTGASPGGQVLGRFAGAGGGSSLSLTGLDAHDFVLVEFDLYLFDSWDKHYTGTSPSNPGTVNSAWNPDIARVSMDGAVTNDFSLEYGRNVLTDLMNDSTYSLTKSGEFGGAATWTGRVLDEVFHVSVLLAHTASTLNLSFTSLGGNGLNDESFALDNVRVSTVVPSPSSVLLLAAGAVFAHRNRRQRKIC